MGKTITMTLDVVSDQEIKRTWRLVETDNFGRDYPNESFAAIGIPFPSMAECFARAWNEAQGENAERILRVVEHVEVVYKLEPGFEP